MHSTLQKIIAQKHIEVAALRANLAQNPDGLLSEYMRGERVRKVKSLSRALQTSQAIIAEIKRASPAKGALADIKDPVQLALTYQAAGAVAISVLTDELFFKGSPEDLQNVSRALADLPCVILRKEFIIDEIQIAQSAQLGADAILLIVAATKNKTEELYDYAQHLGLEVLLEVHTLEELEFALEIQAQVIGINNRNLNTLEVDTATGLHLIQYVPEDVVIVAESGIQDAATAARMFQAGFDALLVGEALVRSNDPAQLIFDMRS